MPHVNDYEKRRTPLRRRQRARILLGLPARGHHRFVPALRAAHRRPPPPRAPLSGGQFRLGLIMLLASLLRFQDEAPALVKVDASRAARAVAVVESNCLFKNVCVLVLIRFRRFGPGHLQHVTKLGEEDLIVGSFGGT
jgi:hypothetical protein